METATVERVVPKFSWSEMTCGEACWTGKEDICRCSCGGKNHGIWRTSKDASVQRTCKIDGILYKLVGVGTRTELYPMQKDLLAKYGLERCYDYYGHGDYIHSSFLRTLSCRGDSERGFPLKIKNATDSQLLRWHELKSLTKHAGHDYNATIALLWELFIIPAPCSHTCQSAKSIEEK